MECPPSLLRKTQIILIITAQDDLTTNKKGIGKKNNKIIISSKLLHVPASAHAFITNAVKEEMLFIPSLSMQNRDLHYRLGWSVYMVNRNY